MVILDFNTLLDRLRDALTEANDIHADAAARAHPAAQSLRRVRDDLGHAIHAIELRKSIDRVKQRLFPATALDALRA